METWILHPKVDCLGNQAEEKSRKARKEERKFRKRQWRKELTVSFLACIVFRVRSNGSGRCLFGGIAQLGERLPCKQEATGSNPVISTNMGR